MSTLTTRVFMGLCLVFAMGAILVPAFMSPAGTVQANDKDKTGDKTKKAEVGPFKHGSGILNTFPFTPAKQTKPKVLESGFADWGHYPVNFQGGYGATIGATSIKVYIDDIEWYYSTSADSGVRSPDGNGQPADGGWQYPDVRQFGVVLYQPGINSYWRITGTDPNSATAVTGLVNTKGVWIAVNDVNGTYNDNWGSFKVHIKIVE